ncbi:MAG: ABC transporter substrate-binding protein [Actinomycetota bacterium]
MKLRSPMSRLAAVLVSMALVGVACSSGSGSGGSGALSFLTFQGALLPEAIKPFTDANPDLKLQASTFDTQDEAIAKLQAGFKADVVYACLTDTQRLVSAGLVQPIDTGRITAWDSLFPYFKDSAQIRVDDKVYMVPAFGGTTGLIYDPEKVPGGVDSFRQLLEDPALEGKVAIEDNPKYGIAMGALALGFEDPYDLTDADLAQVKQWYIEHTSQIRAFFSGESDFFDLYQSGEVVAAFGYKGYDVGLAKQGASVTFAPASEGALTWTCGYSIGANAQDLDGAYSLLDWFLTPEAQGVYATKLNQMVTNQATLDSLPQSVVEEIGLADPAQLDVSIPTQVPANYDRWQKVWQEITSA